MDAQKAIVYQCEKAKDFVLALASEFYYLQKSNPDACGENEKSKEFMLGEFNQELPWYHNPEEYYGLISIYVFGQLLRMGKYSRIVYLHEDIIEIMHTIKETLLRKNKEYGNSALEPVRIFSKASNIEQINVRLDDKLSRMANGGKKIIKEDTVMDFIGYLILKIIAENSEVI